MVESLNEEQSDVFYTLLQNLKNDDANRCTFITGGAGVGKTHLVNVIYQAFHRCFEKDDVHLDKPTLLLSAFTAMAATHLKGTNIHKALGFYQKSSNPDSLLNE